MHKKLWDILKQNRILAAVLFLAGALRCLRPGMYILWWDEVNILHTSLRLARYGEWTWLSNHTSWAAIPGHSPLNNYIIAIPYFIGADPRVPRLLVALMGVAAVGILYVAVKRYFGALAAAMAGVLFAVAAPAVDWSRWVWNPNLTQPFIALWLLTGLMGYYEGRRRARVVHWLALSFAIQTHLGNGLLGPLSLLLIVVAWRRADRWQLLHDTALGWGLAVLSAVPWAIGLFSAGFLQDAGGTASEGVVFSLDYVMWVFAQLAGGVDFRAVERGIAGAGGWWPPHWVDSIYWIQTWLSLAGAVMLLVWGLWRKRFPYAFIALVTLFPMAAFFVTPIGVQAFYLMAVMFGAYSVQAVMGAWLAERGRRAYGAALGLVGLFALAHVWLTLGYWRWIDTEGVREAFRAPVDFHLDLLDEWTRDGNEVVVLAETKEGKYDPNIQERFWAVLGEGYPLRVVNMPQGVPVRPGEQVLASTYAGETIPALFGMGKTAGRLYDGAPVFRVVKIPQGYQPRLSILPEGPDRFDSGVRIVGIDALGPVQPGEMWPIVLVWQPLHGPTDQQYQFSVRLVDESGTIYGQQDVGSLSGWLWREGDWVYNRVAIPVGEALPAGYVPRVQLLMYTLPDIQNAGVVGAEVPWMFLEGE